MEALLVLSQAITVSTYFCVGILALGIIWE
jgi:hypothetical protein